MSFSVLSLFRKFHLFSHFLRLVACQAERELQPWIAKDDDLGQKMWRVNQRIVKLIVELMRNHDSAESLVILASASDLLLRATDGMLVDGEACTLPQLEVAFYNISFSLILKFNSVTSETSCFTNKLKSNRLSSWSHDGGKL